MKVATQTEHDLIASLPVPTDEPVTTADLADLLVGTLRQLRAANSTSMTLAGMVLYRDQQVAV